MLRIRTVTDADSRLLWEWVNDPEVRSASFHSDVIPWEEHVAWFRKKRADPNCYMYILVDEGGRPVGQVRLNVQAGDSAEVAISIAPNQRGRGQGVEALRLACGRLFETTGVKRIVASLKPENIASIRLFEKARFVRQGDEWVAGHKAIKMILDRSHWPEIVEDT